MLGLRSLIVEVLSRSILTSNELLSTFADRHNLPDPTRPSGIDHWQIAIKEGGGLSHSRSNNRTTQPISATNFVTPMLSSTFVEAFDGLSNASTSHSSDPHTAEFRKLARIAELMCGLRGASPVQIKDRKWRIHSYPNCWVGCEGVEWLISHGMADSVRQAVMIGTRMMKHKLISKVSSDSIAIFHNAALFYKFVHPDYIWPLMVLRPNGGLDQEKRFWRLLEKEYLKLNLPKLDIGRILSDLIHSNLARHHKQSISIPGNAPSSTSIQGAATTLIGPNSSMNGSSSSSSSNHLSSHSHSIGGHLAIPSSSSSSSTDPHLSIAPMSPTHNIPSTTGSSLSSDFSFSLRRSSHFQGSELIRHFKKSGLVHSTREAMILATYLLLIPYHQPRLLPPGIDAYFYPIGRDGQISPHLKPKIDQLASQEWYREREAQQAAIQQQQQSQSQNHTVIVNGVVTLADGAHHLPVSNGQPLTDQLITVTRQSPSSPRGSEQHHTVNAEILLPNKDIISLSPPLSPRGPPLTPQAYHAILQENLPSLPYEYRINFLNADIWYRLAIPQTGASPSNSPNSTMPLPGTVPLSPTPTTNSSANHPHIPSLGLNHLPVDALLDSATLPSLVRNHYAGLNKGQHGAPNAFAGVMTSSSHIPQAADWNWEFVQSFGDDSSSYDYDDLDDLVTAVEFNPTGEYLAIGDKAGRVSIVQDAITNRSALGPSAPQLEYKFYTEFQSHDTEFDCLKSVEIEPKINVIEWWKHTASNLMLLTSNDKTIKLWRLGSKPPPKKSLDQFIRSPSTPPTAPSSLPYTDGEEEPAPVGAKRKQCFKNAHSYNIHSVSVNSDGQSFFSADDLRINLWHVDREDECYTIVDLKPVELTDVDELITVARFHPKDCSVLMHGSSKGVIRLADMRARALIDRSSSHMFAVHNKNIVKTYFSEITDSILDAKFSEDGRYILARDYMTLRLWDTRNSSQPIHQAQVHPYLQSQYSQLLDNESIFDQFQCAMSRDGL